MKRWILFGIHLFASYIYNYLNFVCCIAMGSKCNIIINYKDVIGCDINEVYRKQKKSIRKY